MPIDTRFCPDCYIRKFTLVNTTTGQTCEPWCHKYTCPANGWIKQKALKDGILNFIKNWKIIRFWTFTLSSKYFENTEHHYRIMAQSWRYFVTYLRRSKLLSKTENNLQYIRVVELHKSGFAHFHCFFDRFIDIRKVWTLWHAAVYAATELEGDVCYCYVKGIKCRKFVASYVVKYVVKTMLTVAFRLRTYSKSSRVALFVKKAKDGSWVLLRKGSDWSLAFPEPFTLLEVNRNKFTDSDPPSEAIYSKKVDSELYQLRIFEFSDKNKQHSNNTDII